jgi:hypothetical protein
MNIEQGFRFGSVRLYNCIYRWATSNDVLMETQDDLESAVFRFANKPAIGMGSQTYAELLVVCGLLHWANRCWLKISNSERKMLIRGYAKELYAQSREYGDRYDNSEVIYHHIDRIVEKRFG